jgi:hypothetical protein
MSYAPAGAFAGMINWADTGSLLAPTTEWLMTLPSRIVPFELRKLISVRTLCEAKDVSTST